MDITKEKISEAISENWIVLSSGAFILYGIIYANSYYSVFGVPIFSYITITELISFFVSDILDFIILALFILPFIAINRNRSELDRTTLKIAEFRDRLSNGSIRFKAMFEKLKQLEEADVQDIETQKLLQIEIDDISSQIKALETSILDLESLASSIGGSVTKLYRLNTIVFGFFILLTITPLLIIDFWEFFWFALVTIAFFVVYIKSREVFIPAFFALFIWSGFGALTEAYFVKAGKTVDYEIQLKTSTVLTSDSTNYYIGKTEKFVFVKTKEGLVEAYPMEEIGKISIPDQHRNIIYFLKKKLE